MLSGDLKMGDEVQTEVQLVKDYGVIVKIKDQTGFIISEQQASKKYKPGQQLTCKVLDVDPVKKIADLSEKLASMKSSGKTIAVGSTGKAVIELLKDNYAILSFKSNRKALGLCIFQNFNGDEEDLKMPKLGEEVDVRVVGESKNCLQLVPVVKERAKAAHIASNEELREGALVTG